MYISGLEAEICLFWLSDNEKNQIRWRKCDADNLTVKRGAATEADGETEEVDNGDDEDSSDLIISTQRFQQREKQHTCSNAERVVTWRPQVDANVTPDIFEDKFNNCFIIIR